MGQLEEKIDGLVTLLNASRQLPPTAVGKLPEHARFASLDQGAIVTHVPEKPSVQVGQTAAAESLKSSRNPSTLPTPPVELMDIFPGFRVSLLEAEDILRIYNESYSPLFPFVPIPQMTSANDLLAEKPFLFRTIMTAVAPQNATIQKQAAVWFREYMAEHMLVNQEKSIELLQAILVRIAWGDYQFYVASEVTTFIQLAIALVMDLELNKPSRNAGSLPGNLVEEAAKAGGVYRGRAPHTLEDIRTLLGCFYISSMVAALFRRPYTFPHTYYLTTACALIEGAQEYESDEFLVAQIRLQLLTAKGCIAFPSADSDVSAQSDFGAALYMTMASIRNDVESFKKGLPPELQNHYLFSVLYCGMLMRLYEPVIYMRPSVNSSNVTDATRRTEALWCCLEACRMFFSAYQAIPAAELPYLPFSGTSHLSFSLVTVSRLLFLSDSDWDPQLARKHVDLCGIVEHLGAHFCEADQCAAADEWRRKRRFVDEGRSTMMVTSDKVRWIRSWYTSKLVPVEEHQAQTAASTAGDAELPDVDMFGPDVLSLGQFDPSFWAALLNEDLAGGAFNHG